MSHRRRLQELLAGILSVLGAAPLAAAQDARAYSLLPDRAAKMTQASEFYSETVAGEVLVPVSVLGGVARAGLYHVPRHTDLVRLITLAGGVSDAADRERVIIRRRSTPKEPVEIYNFDRLVTHPDQVVPSLAANDVIFIPLRQPFISPDTATVITLASTFVGIILSGIIIANQSHGK